MVNDIKEAKKIMVSSLKATIEQDKVYIKNSLIGEIVEKNKVIKLRQLEDKKYFEIDIENIFNTSPKIPIPRYIPSKLLIIDTKPSGKVKITKNTEIVFMEK